MPYGTRRDTTQANLGHRPAAGRDRFNYKIYRDDILLQRSFMHFPGEVFRLVLSALDDDVGSITRFAQVSLECRNVVQGHTKLWFSLFQKHWVGPLDERHSIFSADDQSYRHRYRDEAVSSNLWQKGRLRFKTIESYIPQGVTAMAANDDFLAYSGGQRLYVYNMVSDENFASINVGGTYEDMTKMRNGRFGYCDKWGRLGVFQVMNDSSSYVGVKFQGRQEVLTCPAGSVAHIADSSNDNTLAIGGETSTVKIVDFERETETVSLDLHSSASNNDSIDNSLYSTRSLQSIDISGPGLAVGTFSNPASNGALRVFDLRVPTGPPVIRFWQGMKTTTATHLAWQAPLLACYVVPPSIENKRQIHVYDLRGRSSLSHGQKHRTPFAESGALQPMATFEDVPVGVSSIDWAGRMRIMFAEYDGSVTIWSLHCQARTRRLASQVWKPGMTHVACPDVSSNSFYTGQSDVAKMTFSEPSIPMKPSLLCHDDEETDA